MNLLSSVTILFFIRAIDGRIFFSSHGVASPIKLHCRATQRNPSPSRDLINSAKICRGRREIDGAIFSPGGNGEALEKNARHPALRRSLSPLSLSLTGRLSQRRAVCLTPPGLIDRFHARIFQRPPDLPTTSARGDRAGSLTPTGPRR